ncbi:MAG: hypothetical protein KDI90_10730 [Alphaproteobacteria bacterium]|nr:hypothetical protein [Alphaproteobacteria bacterium]MCB9975656.1 hypothetical protein [Rhodospirillales bacterium]
MFNWILNVLLIVLAVIYLYRFQEMDAVDCMAEASRVPISVQMSMPDPTLNTELSYSQITQKFRNAHKSLQASPYLQALGVTEFALEMKFGMQFTEKMKSISGNVCLVPESIIVDLALEQTIFLGKSSTRSKCQFKTLMDHEMRHVKINRDGVKKNISRFEAAARQGLALFGKQQGWGPYHYNDSQGKKELLKEYMSAALNRTFKATEQEIDLQQAKVDTAQEYLRIGRSCRW